MFTSDGNRLGELSKQVQKQFPQTKLGHAFRQLIFGRNRFSDRYFCVPLVNCELT